MSGRTWVLRLVVAVAVGHASGAMARIGPALSSVFVQSGTVGTTHSASVGLTSDWAANWSIGTGRLGGYWEGSVGEWSYPGPDGRRTQLTQFAVKPVLRYRFDGGASPWFAEAGVGVTATSRSYRTERKVFSTRFNFGDHLALGRAFGDAGRHELVMRVEHFSNGGIREPNPGETFVQLRYVYRFR